MKKSSKKTLLKQGIAVLLAFSLIFMMQGVMNLSVEAGTEPDEEIESVVNKKYLAENDFENAKLGTYIDAWDYPKTSRDAFIYSETETNKVLKYVQNRFGVGVVNLGMAYTVDDVNEYLRVEAGKTYVINFEYRVEGTPTDDMVIGVAVGKPDLASAITAYDGTEVAQDGCNQSNYRKYFTSYYEDKNVDYKKDTTYNTEWINETYTFTVPDKCDLSVNNALQLYVVNGKTATVYFDNIKVCTTTVSTTKTLFETDYETAYRYELSANKTESVWAHTQNFSGDLRPGYLAEGENTVLYYRHSNYGLGIVVLGHDYAGNEKQDNAAAENAITVEPGVTYKVTFDYKIKGSIGNSDLNIGLAIGKSHFGFASGSPNGGTAIKDNSEYVSQYTTELTFGKNTTPNQEWQTKEAYITVPQDADLTTFNTLLLYAKYGNQQVVKDEDGVTVDYSGVLFDNIKVTALAGVGVSYKTDDHVSNIYNSDGNISYNAMLDSIGNAIKWYTDETHTSAFISSDYVRTGVLDTVSLYGLKDTSLAAFIKGDADGDGIVENDDIHLMRKGILGTDVTYPSRTDIDDSGELDVRDLVRSKKAMNSENNANITIGGVELSNYKFETNGSFTSVVESRISAIESLGGGMSAENTNAISVALNTSLADNLYILKVDNGMVRIEGGSENAVAAALEAIIGYIKAGVSIDSADSMEFIYNGNAYTDYETLILNENF